MWFKQDSGRIAVNIQRGLKAPQHSVKETRERETGSRQGEGDRKGQRRTPVAENELAE